MELTHTACFEAVRSRDPRFDGMFFTGVKSTGIYCRPVCPARTPKPENCGFFQSAAAAAHAGFRPCLRCRPELSPAVEGGADRPLAARVFRFIRDKAAEGLGIPEIAKLAGYGERQLRRIVTDAYGLTPGEIIRNERLLFAKRLLHDTALPVTNIAFASGFRSIRRFNQVFRENLGLHPSEIRARGGSGTPPEMVTLHAAYRPPFDWPEMLGWLSARLTKGVDAVVGGAYLRTVRIGNHTGWVRISDDPAAYALRVEISGGLVPVLPSVMRRVRALLDLDADPAGMCAFFEDDELLGPVIGKFPGIRLPGAWDVFETAVRTIAGQQVSVAAAGTISGRLAERFGGEIETPHPALTRLPVVAEALAGAEVSEVCAAGIPGNRARALIGIARHALVGGLDFPPGMSHETISAELIRLPGIGPWTAGYLALRALRFPDAFPAGDLGLRKAIGKGTAISEKAAEAASLRWRPWRAYAAALLWKSLETT